MGRKKESLIPASTWQAALLRAMETSEGTLNAWARESKINRTQAANYIKIEDPNPQLATLRQIAAGLDCSIDEILPDGDRRGSRLKPWTKQEMAGLELARTLDRADFHEILRMAEHLDKLRKSKKAGGRKKKTG